MFSCILRNESSSGILELTNILPNLNKQQIIREVIILIVEMRKPYFEVYSAMLSQQYRESGYIRVELDSSRIYPLYSKQDTETLDLMTNNQSSLLIRDLDNLSIPELNKKDGIQLHISYKLKVVP